MNLPRTLACAIVALMSTALSGQPIGWDTLEERLDEAAADGWSGAALVVRDGEIVLDEGYGWANAEKHIPNRPDTVFAIGSTPIDFTKVSILLLIERGSLSLDDPITAFFDDVPEDKRLITIGQLMTGESGLRNFHGLPTDRDPDHAWIDREEAVHRILHQELLFKPGTGHAHSHSAFGLLAAIVEIVSGETYQGFARRNLFGPLGMKDTGFFGEPIDEQRLAIGYGESADGDVNAPPNWGPTSWLVMGSGGMVSTTRDMYAWVTSLREGKVLDSDVLDDYWSAPGQLLAGGDMYGFEIVYTEGPGSLFILCTNNCDSFLKRDRFQQLAMELGGLTSPRPRARFSLGVRLGMDDDRLVVDGVVPDGAAARDGLLPGDVFVSANGDSMGPDPLSSLMELLQSGDPIRFVVLRAGHETPVVVTPDARPPGN